MSCQLIRRGFNDTYLVNAGQSSYIFRVYLNHKYYISSIDNYRFELELLMHLKGDDLPVACPIYANSGDLLCQFNTAQGARSSALFSYAPGEEVSKESFSEDIARKLGMTMAQLHLSANRFSSGLTRYHLNFTYLIDKPLQSIEAQLSEHTHTPGAEDQVRELTAFIESLGEIEALRAQVENIPLNDNTYGIIHADLHPGNFHCRNGELTLFDFDHCAYGWRAYDLVIALFMSDSIRDAMIDGYESVRPLTGAEHEALPALSQLRKLWDVGDVLATQVLRQEP